MRRIRAAIVGLGHWGPVVLSNLRASADFEVVGTCDRDPTRGAGHTEVSRMLAEIYCFDRFCRNYCRRDRQPALFLQIEKELQEDCRNQ